MHERGALGAGRVADILVGLGRRDSFDVTGAAGVLEDVQASTGECGGVL